MLSLLAFGRFPDLSGSGFVTVMSHAFLKKFQEHLACMAGFEES